MTICADEAVEGSDETYWADDNAAQPVLLIDEATEAITEALYRIRCGSVLDERDLTATGVALGDLYGGLGQLAGLLTTVVSQCAATDHAGRLEDRLKTLRVMMRAAQQVADELQRGSAAIRLIRRNEKTSVPAHDINEVERFSKRTSLAS